MVKLSQFAHAFQYLAHLLFDSFQSNLFMIAYQLHLIKEILCYKYPFEITCDVSSSSKFPALSYQFLLVKPYYNNRAHTRDYGIGKYDKSSLGLPFIP